jgi:NAD(P)-dependent dehydrogenase (short-subunit alcohol dehydrogenase family)
VARSRLADGERSDLREQAMKDRDPAPATLSKITWLRVAEAKETTFMNIAVVTGTSSGIGFATSLHLARHGYRVFAGMRNLAKAEPLRTAAAEAGLPLEVIALDVTSNASIDEAFRTVAAQGPVDVLVNNAGIGGASPLELTPEAEHRAMFDTNYFGAIGCIQAVLPGMRERRSGVIVNVTSIAGVIAMPNQIAYSASKWALECAGEALAHEVWRFGVRVINVEPGVVMTKIFENSAGATRYDKTSPYLPLMRRNGKFYAAGFRNPSQPEDVARCILDAVNARDYRLRWRVGKDADGFAAGRPRMGDEGWIAMGADLPDDEYNGRIAQYFGIELR